MKKTKKILLIILTSLLLTTGCTKSFRDENTKAGYWLAILKTDRCQ